MSTFPTAQWKGWDLDFLPEPVPVPFDPTYVVVFCITGSSFVLADIPDRGWTTPSGRIEAGESARYAARREAYEEAGVRLEEINLLGASRLSHDDEIRWTSVYVGRVTALEPLPVASESKGVSVVELDALPGIYADWNPLFEVLFDTALNSLRSQV